MKNFILIIAILVSNIIIAQAQRWDTAFVSINSPNNDVLAMCSNSNNVFIGGKFTSTAGLTTNYIAKWDGFDWQILDNSLNGEVSAMAIVNSKLVVGGHFTMAGAISLNHIGIFDGTIWTALGSGTDGPVYAIEEHDEYAYIGGLFSNVDGNSTSNIARYNIALNSWFTFPNGPDNAVYAIDYGTNLTVGGAFTNCGTTATAYAAFYIVGTWTELSSSLNDTVRAIESDDQNQIFIGGDFTQNAPILNDYIARWDGTIWKSAGGFDKEVHALYFADSTIFAGGEFNISGGKPVKKIGEWEGTGWNNLSGGMDSTVLCITMMKRDLYLGGVFSLANINESINFARWGALPKILTEPVATSICEGENHNIQITVVSSVPETYQWFLNGNLVPDSTNNTFNINNADAIWSGDYYCEIDNQFGTTISSIFNIEIVEPVSLNNQITDTVSCLGNNISLFVSVLGTNPIFHWFKDGSQIVWANDSTLNLTNISNTDAATYYCQILNMCDTIISNDIVLSINNLPSVTFTGLDAEYCSSDEVDTLYGIPAGGLFSGSGIVDSTFNPNSLSGNQNITYTYTDDYGCINSSTQATNVKLALGVYFSGLEDYYCIENDADTLTPNRSGGIFTGTGITDSIFNPTTAGIGMHTIEYQWLNTNGCMSYYSEETNVQDPDVSLGNDTSLCIGDTIILIAEGDSGTYIWDTGATTQNIEVWPNISTEYSVKLSSVGGCFRYDTINVSVNLLPIVSIDTIASHYCEYSDADTLIGIPVGGNFTGNGILDSVFYPQSAGVGTHVITYEYTDVNGCSSSATTSTEVQEAQYGGVSFFGLEMQYCFSNEESLLTGSPAGGIFSGEGISGDTFYPNQTAGPGIYYINYTLPNDSNCGNYYSQPVQILDFPELIIPKDTEICRGLYIEIIPTGDTGTYEWSTGYIGDTLVTPIYYPQDIVVTLTTLECNITDTIHIAISDPRPLIINDTSMCRFDTLIAPEGFVEYKWQVNIENGRELIIIETNSYRIDVVDSFGCTNYTNAQITMKESPVIGFSNSYTLYQEHALILGTTSGYDEYLWSDGYTGYLQTFYGDSLTVGMHTFWLYARVGDCELSDTTIIEVKNAITVSDPEMNNVFTIYPNPASTFIQISSANANIESIKIYDITGRLVVEKQDVNSTLKTIDISKINKGTYFIEINNNSNYKSKFVKQ